MRYVKVGGNIIRVINQDRKWAKKINVQCFYLLFVQSLNILTTRTVSGTAGHDNFSFLLVNLQAMSLEPDEIENWILLA